jgi:hypothetical protein
MSDDLVPASACVDWADAQLPVLEGRIKSWREGAPYEVVEELHPQRGEKIYKLMNVRPLPAIVNVEAGLIIHTLRCSLDLLANILAKRNGFADPEHTQFPIGRTRAAFMGGKNAGHKEIKLLSPAHRKIIEDLEPWEGGHRHLFDLHALDIARKHRRLIAAYVAPASRSVSNVDRRSRFQWAGEWRGFEDHSVIGRASIGAPKPDIDISLQVTLDEGRTFPAPPILAILNEFSRSTREIVDLFRDS